MKSEGWDPNPVTLMSLYEEEEIQGLQTMWGHSGKVAIYKPRREASGETRSVDTLSLGFQPPELWEDKFLWSYMLCGILLLKPQLANAGEDEVCGVSDGVSVRCDGLCRLVMGSTGWWSSELSELSELSVEECVG